MIKKDKRENFDYKEVFTKLYFPLVFSFVNMVTMHTLMRDIRKFISHSNFRRIPSIETLASKLSGTFDKNTYLAVMRGFFVLAWIVLLISVYYGFLVKRFGSLYAYYYLNIASLLILLAWDIIYLVIGDNTPLFSEDSLKTIAKFSVALAYPLANLHIGFITGFIENIGPFFITLYWAQVSSLANHFCKTKEDRRSVFKDVSSYSTFGHLLSVVPLLFILLTGLATSEQICSFSYRVLYIFLLLNIVSRYYISQEVAKIDPDYQEETISSEESSLYTSLKSISTSTILVGLFINNIIYFTSATILENLTGSLTTKLADDHLELMLNTDEKYDTLYYCMYYSSQTCFEQADGDVVSFIYLYKGCILQFLYLITSLLTGLSSYLITYISNYFENNVEKSGLLQLCSSSSDKFSSFEKLTIFAVKMLIGIGVFEFLFGVLLYLNVVTMNVLWLFQAYVVLGLFRSIKYAILDVWRQETYIIAAPEEIRALATSAIDMYSPRLSKSVLLSGITLVTDMLLQHGTGINRAGAYNYEHSVIYLPVYMLIGYFWLRQHETLIENIDEGSTK